MLLESITQIFNLIFLGPIINLLVLIYRALDSLHIPGALGFSVIILTVLIRLVIWPFMSAQLKSAKKMADLKPHLSALKSKHKDDKQAYARAQMDLYKEHGINPAGGCLPTLIQFPIIIALYQAILAFFDSSAGLNRINDLLYLPSWHLDKAPDLHFFGVNLANKPSEFATVGYFLLAVPLLTALLTFLQSKMMLYNPVKIDSKDSKKEIKEKESMEDTMAAVQGQMVYMMPLMVGFFSWQFPIGLALYWNIFTLIGILQQYLISGWGGLATLFSPLKKS